MCRCLAVEVGFRGWMWRVSGEGGCGGWVDEGQVEYGDSVHGGSMGGGRSCP